MDLGRPEKVPPRRIGMHGIRRKTTGPVAALTPIRAVAAPAVLGRRGRSKNVFETLLVKFAFMNLQYAKLKLTNFEDLGKRFLMNPSSMHATPRRNRKTLDLEKLAKA